MGLTSQDLVRALGVSCGGQPDHPAEAVMLVRRAQPSFAATLYSAWLAEGLDLNPGLRFELDAARARIDFYRSVAARLSSEVPGLMPVKGLEVAGLYPDGLARAMNDLDYVTRDERELWQAASVLMADGWDLETATFSRIGGGLQMMVSILLPHPDPCQLPYGVEIMSYCSYGDLCGAPPLIDLPAQWRAPAIKNTLMLLYERFEQPYRARDLVDAALLLGSATKDETARLAAALRELRLEPEYRELASRVAEAGLGPLPEPRHSRLGDRAARASRAARSAGFFVRPLGGTARHLQRRRLFGRQNWADRMAWTAVQRLLTPGAAVNAGLLAFGLPLQGPPPDVRSAVLRRSGKLAWVDTPAARFLLTIGDDVSQAEIDKLSPAVASGPQVIAESAA